MLVLHRDICTFIDLFTVVNRCPPTDKLYEKHIYNGLLFTCKEKWNYGIFKTINKTEDHQMTIIQNQMKKISFFPPIYRSKSVCVYAHTHACMHVYIEDSLDNR